MNTQELVQSYFKALHTQDWTALRALLRDDLRFEGPIDKFDRADDLVAALQKLAKIAKGADVQHMFIDGDQACVVYDLHTEVADSQVAEWFVADNGKIARIRVHFDARPFAAAFAK